MTESFFLFFCGGFFWGGGALFNFDRYKHAKELYEKL